MQKIPEKIWVITGLVITGVVFLVLAFTTEIPEGGADNYAHFNIARWAFRYPHLFLDHWGKPVFTILSAPFAQFGILGIRIFNIVCGLFAAWFGYLAAKKINLPIAWFTPVAIIFTPIYFIMMGTSMTEILFSLFIVVGIYAVYDKKYILSALIISFSFLIRSEGIVFFPFVLGVYILKKEFKAIPYLFAGFIIFGFLGMIFFNKNFFWLISENPYTNNNGGIYGRGTWYSFFKKMPFYLDYSLMFLLLIGTIMILFDWRKKNFSTNGNQILNVLLLTGLFWGFFATHSYLWWKGGASLGLTRVMASVTPLAVLIAHLGLKTIKEVFKNKTIFTLVLTIFVVSFTSRSCILYYKSLRNNDASVLAEQMVDYMKLNNLLSFKIVTNDPFIVFLTGNDPWDFHKIQYGVHDIAFPEKDLPDSTIFIWDKHFSPNEGRLPLENIVKNNNFRLINKFEIEKPEKNRNSVDYELYIFQKTDNKNKSN
jgi:hypothetical protein